MLQEVRCRHVECDRDVYTGPKFRGFDRPDDELDRLAIAFQPRPIAAFVANQATFVPSAGQQLAEAPVNSYNPLQTGSVVRRTNRRDQDILKVEIAARVETPGDHVGHGERHGWRASGKQAVNVTVERNLLRSRRGVSGGE